MSPPRFRVEVEVEPHTWDEWRDLATTLRSRNRTCACCGEELFPTDDKHRLEVEYDDDRQTFTENVVVCQVCWDHCGWPYDEAPECQRPEDVELGPPQPRPLRPHQFLPGWEEAYRPDPRPAQVTLPPTRGILRSLWARVGGIFKRGNP